MWGIDSSVCPLAVCVCTCVCVHAHTRVPHTASFTEGAVLPGAPGALATSCGSRRVLGPSGRLRRDLRYRGAGVAQRLSLKEGR